MNFGELLIFGATAATFFSGIAYWMAGTDHASPSAKRGRVAFQVMTLLTTVATVYLFYLFLTHRFQVAYVSQYSSTDLSTGLLISALWAGQEGSFLLWAFLTAVMGLFLIRSAGKLENRSMLFLNLVQLFFLLILIKASPFKLLPHIPAEGNGLNPLLQNFWMIIHPPILFVGYAAIAFPAVLALAAMWEKEFDGWIRQAFPWAVFSSLMLGAGIIIGGFWSYETLGWGGYWAWDPVENSSLIPWLTILALTHGILLQKRNGVLRRTNLVFAVLSFVLVLYATFLTRSGVLADFSVHSFQDLGVNNYLIADMVAFLALGAALFVNCLPAVKKEPLNLDSLNRENALVAAMWMFAFSAFLTFIGTSSPLITSLFGNPSQVDINFYNRVNLPIGILMALLLGLTPMLIWREEFPQSIPRRLIPSIIVGLLAAVLGFAFNITSVSMLIFLFSSGFGLASNVIAIVRKARINWINIGGPLSHFGTAILFIGIVVSGQLSTTQRTLLVEGESKWIDGHEYIYTGFTEVQGGKSFAEIEMKADGETYIARPAFYYSRYNQGVMREPHVFESLFADIYLSPLERREHDGAHAGAGMQIKKGETKNYADLQVTFLSFEMGNHLAEGQFGVGAVLDIKRGDEVRKVTPVMVISDKGRNSIPAPVGFSNPGEKSFEVSLTAMNADAKMVELTFSGLEAGAKQKEQLLIEISHKPFMSILWAGTVLIMLGSIISFTRRVGKHKED